jgi:N-acetylmuramoyl-L-alanine amidase
MTLLFDALGWLEQGSADRRLTPNVSKGRSISPTGIVMHYTAGETHEGAVEWLTNPAAKASAHFVVGVNGELTQLAPLFVRTWHAGPSAYRGLTDMNSHTVGIELVNPGFLRETSEGYLTTYGKRLTLPGVCKVFGGTMKAPMPQSPGTSSVWPLYPEAQLLATEALVGAIAVACPIRFVAGHSDVDTRGWKNDPGPAFPMPRFTRLVQGREGAETWVVTASNLRVRLGPGAGQTFLTSLPRGTHIEVSDVTTDGWLKLANGSGYVAADFALRMG